jgi:putative transposon-encoded protein
MPRKLVISKGNLVLTEEIEGFIQRKVTPFGTGAKVDCPKEFLGRTVYIVVCKE